MTGPPATLPAGWADAPHTLAVRAEVTPYGSAEVVPVPVLSGAAVTDAQDTWRSSASLRTPFDSEVWALVRGWAAARLTVAVDCVTTAGQVVPVPVFLGVVRTAGVDRPGDGIDLTAASYASVVSDLPMTAAGTSPAGPSAAAAIQTVISGALPGALFEVLADAPAVAASWPAGAARWPVVEALADGAGLEVWQTPEGVFRIDVQPEAGPMPPPVDHLRVGEGGAVTASGSDYNREALANGYGLVAEWVDGSGVSRSAAGWAYDTDPDSPTRWDGPSGRRMIVDTLRGEYAASALQGIAAARLWRAQANGRGARVTTNLRPWLAAGDAVRVTLPTAGYVQTARRVEHDFERMATVTDTRQSTTSAIDPDPA